MTARQPSTAAARSLLEQVTESAVAQRVGIVVAVGLVAAWHWANDGLWPLGDASRHAVTGALLGDMLRSPSTDPLGYALSYFARYPALVLGAYPPLFHLLEGVVFAVTGPSTAVAKGLVLASTALLGLYTHLWGRRWIGPAAGWAGACVVLTPWMVRYSNAVLLNVPAAALGVAALYHAQAWIESSNSTDRRRFIVSTLAAIATYLPGAIVVPMAGAWMVTAGAASRLRALWLPVTAFAAAAVASAWLLPEHFARQGPSLARVWDPVNWQFYARGAPDGLGWWWLVLAPWGLLFGVVTTTRRTASIRLLLALVAAALCLAVLPGRDTRYATILAPLVVLAGFTALVCGLGRLPGGRRLLVPLTIVGLLFVSVREARVTEVPRVAGFETVASILKDLGPADRVLYSGVFDGVFTYYVRAFDPHFERGVMQSNRLLSDFRQAADFTWHETPRVSTPADVVARIQQESGCRWIAVEQGGEWVTNADRLLMAALRGPEFQFVRSIQVEARRVYRVDVYRFAGDLAPAPPMDLSFPSFTSRRFTGIRPVPSTR